MPYTKVVCFDLEMCCWETAEEVGKKTGEIIEIGLSKIDLEKGEITKRAQYYVKPEKDEISSFCYELTGITDKVIRKQGRSLSDVVNSMVRNFGGNNTVYAAWGHDDDVLRKECAEKGIDFPFRNYINLAVLDRVKNRRKTKVNQIDVMKEYGLDFEGAAHSGYVDAYNLSLLALKML